jgi:WD40 repeat protein/serine/threonine protein kinase/energy-coupling factor transporter ATP-binding protein EcfA2
MDLVKQKPIKGYELKEKIGTGGFGAVYRAYQSTVGREVAVKIILPSLANQADFIRRFEGEAQLVARLEHPHITPLYDYWRDPEGAYLVMRWLRGGSLQDALNSGKFELRAAALLLDQIAGALSLAHRNGIIHRDIKPANILLDEDGNAYLTDFGIAKDLNIQGNNTQPDVIVGSLDYISPEQARSEPVTNRTDIYSLGVTLFEMITGHHPFENMSSIERLFKHINDPLPEITGLDSAISDSVNLVIQKATAKNPENRFADALAFSADFREAIGLNRQSTTVIELLTQREHEILSLIIEGLSNKEIAQKLTITHGTVKWYVNQIYEKLGVRSRVQAIVRARELNLLTKGGESSEAIALPTEDFQPDNPYKGLRAFQAADNQDFFGREKLTEKLLKRMAEKGEFGRFLAVVGPSGSGKSSLVKAGLIPALWRGEIPASEKWYIVEFTPASQPIDELEIALTKLAANQAANLHEHLTRDEHGLLRAANLILPNDGTELVLVIDQFEEVFTMSEDETERSHFLNLLYAAVSAAKSRVRVIITLRADFYDRPLHYPDFGEMLKSRLETILPLSAEELEAAIRKPAERVGAIFEAGLVASMVADMNYQAGALPLLQYALTELFEHRKGRLLSREAYDAMGKSTGALAKRADEIYQDFDEAGKAAAKQLFLRLVTVTEGAEDTRRRASRMELLALGEDAEVIEDVIDTYSSYRLLTLDNDPISRTPTVELAHEAILREWERLRNWLDESRDELRIQRQVSAMAQEWVASKRDKSFLARGSRLQSFETWVESTQISLTPIERQFISKSIEERGAEAEKEAEQQMRENVLKQRSQRFLQALVALFALAAVLSGGLAAFAFTREEEAQEARAVSEANLDLANANFRRAEALRLAGEANLLTFQNGNSETITLLGLASMNLQFTTQGNTILETAALLPYASRIYEDIGPVNTFVLSPDGSQYLTTAISHSYRLWDIETGEVIREFVGHTENVSSAIFSDDGHYILSTGSEDSTARLWDVETGQEIQQFVGHQGWVGRAAISPDNRLVATTGEDGTTRLWDAETGQEIRQLNKCEGSIHWAIHTTFSPDGRYLLSFCAGTTAELWDVETGEQVQQFVGHTDWLWGRPQFSADGRYLLTASYDKTARLWDVETGQEIQQFVGSTAHVIAVAISPDGRYALTGSDDKTARLFDIQTGLELKVLSGHSQFIPDVAFSPDGNLIYTASADGTIRLWNLVQEPTQFIGHTDNIGALAYSSDGNYVVTGSASSDRSVRIWDSHTGQELRRFDDFVDGIYDLALSPDNRYLVAVPGIGPSYLYDLETGQLQRTFEVCDECNAWSVAYAPDGKYIAIGYRDGKITLWDATTGLIIHELLGHETNRGIEDLAFSPDSKYLVSASLDTTARLWNVETAELLAILQHSSQVFTAEFSPDGQTVATGDSEAIIHLWEFQTAQEIKQFQGHSLSVGSLAFSPDGHYLASTGGDGTARLWDLETSQELVRYVDKVSIDLITFSPDGRFVLTANHETARLWFTDYRDLIDILCSRLVRGFTDNERARYGITDEEIPCRS